MTVPQPAVEAAAKAISALFDVFPTEARPAVQEFKPDARAALEAALPHIRNQIAAEIRSQRVICPVHAKSDCSPLLNGCSLPNLIHQFVEASAHIAEQGKHAPEPPRSGSPAH